MGRSIYPRLREAESEARWRGTVLAEVRSEEHVAQPPGASLAAGISTEAGSQMRRQLNWLAVLLLAWGCRSGTEPRPSDVGSLTLSPATTQTTGIGGAIPLTVTVTDSLGAVVAAPAVRWMSSDRAKVALSADTGTTVVLSGLAATSASGVTITAASGGRQAHVKVIVSSVAAPRITAISVATLAPGMTGITFTGTGFGAAAGANTVLIDDVGASVDAASATRLTVSVPASGFSCLPRRDVWVHVTANGVGSGRHYPFAAAVALPQAIGQATILSPGEQTSCVELAANGSVSYVVGIVNAKDGGSTSPQLRLQGAASAPSALTAPSLAERRGAARAAGRMFRARALGISEAIARASERTHERLLAVDRSIVHRRRLGTSRPVARAQVASPLVRALTQPGTSRLLAPAVNDTLAFRVRDINTDDDCTRGFTVRARTVYAGSKAIVFEDVTAPLAGTMDGFFQRIGAEFDEITYPMLVQNFGDPLAHDAQLAGHGKVLMLFTPLLNDRFQNVAGFVSACDFFPYDTTTGPNQDLVSNEGAIFYAFVPKTSSERPQREAFIRGVLAHEAKHLAGYAAKLANGTENLEEAWLEEATAQIASEIYQRTYSNSVWKQRARYETSVGCEPPLTQVNGCAGDRPMVMLHHFGYLYDYLSDRGPLSPLSSDAASYYGGAWSFVRWAVDQYASSESGMLKAMTQSTTQFGIANLVSQTGTPFDQMIVRWSLASALARYPGLTPSDPKLTVPSWDQRGIFAGMHQQLATPQGDDAFPLEYPLVPFALRYGTIDALVPYLPGGSAVFFELSGPLATSQTLELRSDNGGQLQAGNGLRVGIVRVR
jgi:hypothetical protein